jgi:peptidoglycan/LPS O-acetylase OafA/YrhL
MALESGPAQMRAPRIGARLPALDGLRALAAISVLAFHVTNTTAPALFDPGLPRLFRYGVRDLGANGVACFFVLSGFLLGLPFLAWLLGDGPGVSVRRYLRARVLRIFPLWWLVLAVVVCTQEPWLLREPFKLLLLATLQHSFDQDLLRQVVRPAWTLVIEISFYAVLPIAAVLASGPIRRLRWSNRVLVLTSAITVVVAASLAFQQMWLDAATIPHPDRRVLSFLLPTWADRFGLGMLAAVAFLVCRRRDVRIRWWPPILAGGALYCVATIQTRNLQVTASGLIALACALLVFGLTAPERSPVIGLLSTRPLRYLGRISYGMYLWHLPLLYVLVDAGLVRHDAQSQIVPAILGLLALTVAVSAVSYHLIERPALARIDGRRRTRPAASRPGGASPVRAR